MGSYFSKDSKAESNDAPVRRQSFGQRMIGRLSLRRKSGNVHPANSATSASEANRLSTPRPVLHDSALLQQNTAGTTPRQTNHNVPVTHESRTQEASFETKHKPSSKDHQQEDQENGIIAPSATVTVSSAPITVHEVAKESTTLSTSVTEQLPSDKSNSVANALRTIGNVELTKGDHVVKPSDTSVVQKEHETVSQDAEERRRRAQAMIGAIGTSNDETNKSPITPPDVDHINSAQRLLSSLSFESAQHGSDETPIAPTRTTKVSALPQNVQPSDAAVAQLAAVIAASEDKTKKATTHDTSAHMISALSRVGRKSSSGSDSEKDDRQQQKAGAALLAARMMTTSDETTEDDRHGTSSHHPHAGRLSSFGSASPEADQRHPIEGSTRLAAAIMASDDEKSKATTHDVSGHMISALSRVGRKSSSGSDSDSGRDKQPSAGANLLAARMKASTEETNNG